MQISRLFEIIYVLLNKKNVTAAEMAKRFEVSQRTIYRDIETLNTAGIPIFTTRGKWGGIGLLDSFVLNKSLLSEQEQNEILSALQSMNAARTPATSETLSKLSLLFNKNSADWIEVDFSNWPEETHFSFNLIKSAVLNKNVIFFEYYSSYGEKTSRRAEPLQLWFKYKFWYLKAYCLEKQDIRLFKLSRIKNVQLTSASFERTLAEVQPMLERSRQCPTLITVTLQINASQAYRVYDEFETEQIKKNEEGDFIVTASFAESEWIYGYILSFGPSAKLLEPAHLLPILQERLEKTLKQYL